MNSNILLVNLIYDLYKLIHDYDSSSDELINGFEIFRDDIDSVNWVQELCSENSIFLLKRFSKNWFKILSKKAYGLIGVFMDIDEDWRKILLNDLFPLLKALKQDATLNNISIDFEIIYRLKPRKVEDIDEFLRIVGLLSNKAIRNDRNLNVFFVNEE